MARFISHTIWSESGEPLELIAFPWCCVGVIGCSKAAPGSDSWAEVGQKQLALAPSPAACQKALNMVHPCPKCMYLCVRMRLLVYVCNITESQLETEYQFYRLPQKAVARNSESAIIRAHVNIWKRWATWRIRNSEWRLYQHFSWFLVLHDIRHNQGDTSFSVYKLLLGKLYTSLNLCSFSIILIIF